MTDFNSSDFKKLTRIVRMQSMPALYLPVYWFSRTGVDIHQIPQYVSINEQGYCSLTDQALEDLILYLQEQLSSMRKGWEK